MSSKTSRVYLTKKELNLNEAVALVALIKKISADAILTESEVTELKNWLDENTHVDIPAFTYLADMINEILEDKIVTDDELRNLYSGLEKVLPKELRQELINIRKLKEKENFSRIQDEYDKAEIEAIKKAIKASEQDINEPFDEWPLCCFGTKYDGRSTIINRHAKPGQALFLELEPENNFSAHAIKVLLSNGKHIGYIQDYKAKKITKYLQKGCKYYAEIQKIYDGDGYSTPDFILFLFHPKTTNPIAVSIGSKQLNKNGCLGIMMLAAGSGTFGLNELYKYII